MNLSVNPKVSTTFLFYIIIITVLTVIKNVAVISLRSLTLVYFVFVCFHQSQVEHLQQELKSLGSMKV